MPCYPYMNISPSSLCLSLCSSPRPSPSLPRSPWSSSWCSWCSSDPRCQLPSAGDRVEGEGPGGAGRVAQQTGRAAAEDQSQQQVQSPTHTHTHTHTHLDHWSAFDHMWIVVSVSGLKVQTYFCKAWWFGYG